MPLRSNSEWIKRVNLHAKTCYIDTNVMCAELPNEQLQLATANIQN